MRRPTRSLVTLLAVALLAPLLTAPAAAQDHPGPCAIARVQDQTVHDRVKALIRCAAKRWEVHGGAAKAICIARTESGLNPKSTSADGTYLGLFQHSADDWPDRYKAWTLKAWKLDPRALNGRTNTIVTIRMVSANGWGPWNGVGDC